MTAPDVSGSGRDGAAGDRAGFWDRLPTKMAGLRALAAHGLPVPPTVEVGPSGCAAPTGDADWVVRVDAPPPVRFFGGGAAGHGNGPPGPPGPAARACPPGSGYTVFMQRRLVRRCDGIALRTSAGAVVIEVQPDQPGNFFRDGSTPRRWVLPGDVRAGVEVLPPSALAQLLDALVALPAASCVEWVLTPDERLYFVDLKPLPQDYLAAVSCFASMTCCPILCGTTTGTVSTGAVKVGAGPLIHAGWTTRVDLLLQLGPWSGAVVFTGGGLLSHAPVYAAQCGLPVLVCAPGHLPGLVPGAVGTLSIEPVEHRFAPMSGRRIAG